MNPPVSYKPLFLVLGILLVGPCTVFIFGTMIDAHWTRYRVKHQLDHAGIATAGLKLLGTRERSPTPESIRIEDLPETIATTNPSYAVVHDGKLHIEYGGGFGHFGLVVTPIEIPMTEMHQIAENVYYYEGD